MFEYQVLVLPCPKGPVWQHLYRTRMHIVYGADNFHLAGLFQFRDDRAVMPDIGHGEAHVLFGKLA